MLWLITALFIQIYNLWYSCFYHTSLYIPWLLFQILSLMCVSVINNDDNMCNLIFASLYEWMYYFHVLEYFNLFDFNLIYETPSNAFLSSKNPNSILQLFRFMNKKRGIIFNKVYVFFQPIFFVNWFSLSYPWFVNIFYPGFK